jgi:hypothetical protein
MNDLIIVYLNAVEEDVVDDSSGFKEMMNSLM